MLGDLVEPPEALGRRHLPPLRLAHELVERGDLVEPGAVPNGVVISRAAGSPRPIETIMKVGNALMRAPSAP